MPWRDAVREHFDLTAAQFDSIYEMPTARTRLRTQLTRRTVLLRKNRAFQHVRAVAAARVLDVGCGPGHLALELGAKGVNVSGIDFAPGMVEIARRRAAEQGIPVSFEVADVLDLKPDQRFDVAVALGFFDYVEEAEAMLVHISGLATRVVASFPIRAHPLVPFRTARLRREGCPLRLYDRKEVLSLANHARITDASVTRVGRDLLLVGQISEGSASVKTRDAAAT